MSVRVRLTRVGSKKNAVWRVVVADQRSPRDGRIIESIGHYNPQTEPSTIVIDRERLDHWIEQGAQPTNTIRKLMRAPNTVPRAVKPANVPEPQEVPEPAPAEAAGVAAESGTEPEAAASEAEAPAAPAEQPPAEPAAAADAEPLVGDAAPSPSPRPPPRPSPRPPLRPSPTSSRASRKTRLARWKTSSRTSPAPWSTTRTG